MEVSPPPALPHTQQWFSVQESVDSNGRKYVLGSDGCVAIDDALAKGSIPPLALPRMVEVPECGKSHCVGVAADLGKAISWATTADGNHFGQLGCGDRLGSQRCEPYLVRPVALPSAAGRITSVAAGDAHSAFVSSDGGLWLCGSDRWLQLGLGPAWSKGAIWQRLPKPVPKLAGVHIVDVACGGDHTVALDIDGKAWAFGRGEHGQLFGASHKLFTSPPVISAALSLLTRPATTRPAGRSGGARLEGVGHSDARSRSSLGLVARVVARGHCTCALDTAGDLLACIGKCEQEF